MGGLSFGYSFLAGSLPVLVGTRILLLDSPSFFCPPPSLCLDFAPLVLLLVAAGEAEIFSLSTTWFFWLSTLSCFSLLAVVFWLARSFSLGAAAWSSWGPGGAGEVMPMTEAELLLHTFLFSSSCSARAQIFCAFSSNSSSFRSSRAGARCRSDSDSWARPCAVSGTRALSDLGSRVS